MDKESNVFLATSENPESRFHDPPAFMIRLTLWRNGVKARANRRQPVHSVLKTLISEELVGSLAEQARMFSVSTKTMAKATTKTTTKMV
ncbi:MAG: hypothetical protein ACRECW_11870 [Phyllobacterium sp.]